MITSGEPRQDVVLPNIFPAALAERPNQRGLLGLVVARHRAYPNVGVRANQQIHQVRREGIRRDRVPR